MLSVKATDAYKVYSGKDKSPKKNILAWEDYLRKIYDFYGIQLNPDSKDYDVRNSYLNIQIRYNQNSEPYAVTEYIGIGDDDFVERSLDIEGQESDWDFSCQIGDMLEIREAFIFDIINQLPAKYSEVVSTCG